MFFGSSIVGFAGSNSVESMGFFLLCLLRIV